MAKHIYVAFFTGIAGSSIGMFLIGDGIIVGADGGGLKYDGIMEAKADGSLEGMVGFTVPAGVTLISGLTSNEPQTLTVHVVLPRDFDNGDKITRLETPAGPINARFERLREVP